MRLASNRHLLEQYKTCADAAAVSAMQEKILADLEKSYDESRRAAGEFLFADFQLSSAFRGASCRTAWALYTCQAEGCALSAPMRWVYTL